MRTHSFVLGALALGLLSFATGCAVPADNDDLEQRNMAVVRKAHADLEAGDIEAFKSAIGPGYVRHCQAMPPGLQELHGTEEFFAFLEAWLVTAPGYRDSLSNMIAQGDRVAYISTLTGTQTGPMGDLPASGKDFTLVNIVIQRLENEKVVETWVSWDNLAMLSQLGFAP